VERDGVEAREEPSGEVADGKLDIFERGTNMWMKIARGDIADRFDKIRKTYLSVTKETKNQIEREGKILDAYRDYRGALKHAEVMALEVLKTIADPDFLAGVREKGAWLERRLATLAQRRTRVRELRGRGLMWGIELAEPAAPFVTAAREAGLLVVTAGPTVLRLVPPLVISTEDLERGVAILEEVLA